MTFDEADKFAQQAVTQDGGFWPKLGLIPSVFLSLMCLAVCLLVFLDITRDGVTRSFSILAINDVYRIEALDGGEVAGMGRIRALRERLEKTHPDLLMLHAGDFLYPSFMSNTERKGIEGTYGEHMIEAMNRLDGNAHAYDPKLITVFGNHEFDYTREPREDPDGRKTAAALKMLERLYTRIADSQFRWLHTNINLPDGATELPQSAKANLEREIFINLGGIRVGIFGLTIQSTTPIGGEIEVPAVVARKKTLALREQGAEFVIALTHLKVQEDMAILGHGDASPDLIIGGHEHDAMTCEVHGRYVLKADADARTANLIKVSIKADGTKSVEDPLRPIVLDGAEDPELAAWVKEERDRFEKQFCSRMQDEADCLSRKVATTPIAIDATEATMRSSSTAIGNWVADLMLKNDPANAADADAQGDVKAPLALINSGAFRLNQNYSAGAGLNGWAAFELLPFDSKLVSIEITHADLYRYVRNALKNWPGDGSWPQIAGFAIRYSAANAPAFDIEIDDNVIADDTTSIRLVTTEYVAGTAFPGAKSLVGSKTDLRAVIRQEMSQQSFQNLDAQARFSTDVSPAGACEIAAI